MLNFATLISPLLIGPDDPRACGNSVPQLSQGVKFRARPYGDSCREPHPALARFRPYRASILSPLAHHGPRRSACGRT